MQGPDAAKTPFPMRVLSHRCGRMSRDDFNYIIDGLREMRRREDVPSPMMMTFTVLDTPPPKFRG